MRAGQDRKGALTMKQKSYLTFICAVAMVGGLMFGFDIAIISGANTSLQSYFHLDELELGWGTGSLVLGAMFGALGSGGLADRYGRKRVLSYVALLFALSCLGSALSQTFVAFVSSRIVGGLSVGAASVLAPMYVAEVAPKKIRGMLVSVYQLTIVIGILISYLINYGLYGVENDWRWMFATGIAPSVLFFLGLFAIPESPRWLYLKGQKEKCRAVIGRIAGPKEADLEVEEIARTLEDQKSTSKLSDLWAPSARKASFVGFLIAGLIQLNGMNAVVNYAPKIFQGAGFEIHNALLNTSFIGLINFIFTFVAIIVIDKVGRKTLYLAGSLGMSVSLLCLAATYFMHLEGVLTMLFVLAFVAFFAACIGPVFWTLVAEIFPNRIRGKAVAIASAIQWSVYFLVALLFPRFLELAGGGIAFLFFAGMTTLQFLLVRHYLPETRGKSLEEIEMHWHEAPITGHEHQEMTPRP
jgi:sugar porter (SP) family MFS transporter